MIRNIKNKMSNETEHMLRILNDLIPLLSDFYCKRSIIKAPY